MSLVDDIPKRARRKNWTGEYGRERGDSNYLEVRYEDLCSDPIKTLQSVSSFCGLSWDENMLTALAKSHANPSRKNVPLAKVSLDQSVLINPRKELNGWPTEWTESDKQEFLNVAEATMSKLSYL